MKNILILIGGMTLLTGLSGCVTFNDSSARTAAREDMNIMREDLNRVQGRVETIELENRQIVNEVEKLRVDSADTRNQAALQKRLDILEQRMQALDAARAKDKQAIVDQLSAKIAEIMSRGSGRLSRPSAISVSSGNEHIVQEGEMLSTIAAAYKIKTSALIEANDLANPDNLRAGQRLVIPR